MIVQFVPLALSVLSSRRCGIHKRGGRRDFGSPHRRNSRAVTLLLAILNNRAPPKAFFTRSEVYLRK